MRLIDADEINVKQWFVFPDNRKTMTEALAEAPTIDAVPVVRCKDCKWWGLPEGMYATENVKHCEFGRYMVASDGYCVYGEVKDDGD